MTNQFESILDECITALQAGVRIDDILAEVPEYVNELRPLLYAAALLADQDPILVPAKQKAALRAKYMDEVASLPAQPPPLSERIQAVYHILKRRLTREAILSDLVTVTITAVLTITMSLLMLNYVAIDAIPGDVLYRFKRASENLQLTFAWSDAQQQTLEYSFAQRRLYEVEQLLQQNRAGLVEFSGVVESQGENLWLIEGYPVVLPEDANLKGEIHIGSTVRVIGFLRTNRDLVADTIEVVE